MSLSPHWRMLTRSEVSDSYLLEYYIQPCAYSVAWISSTGVIALCDQASFSAINSSALGRLVKGKLVMDSVAAKLMDDLGVICKE